MSAVPTSLTAECLAEQSSRGPRYTSYPPATEFGPIATPRVVRELATIQCEGLPASLWEEAIAAARLPVHRGTVLDADDRIRRTLIDRLMCDGEVDLSSLQQRFGIEPKRYFAGELEALKAHGELATLEGTTIRTTPLGKLLVRNVCMLFDRYLPQRDAAAGARFSSTI